MKKTFNKYEKDFLSKVTERVGEKSRKDLIAIGCEKVRMWDKWVEVVSWGDINATVVVKTPLGIARYQYPFKVYHPFVNLEVVGDGYLNMFSNGIEYRIGEDRYGVIGDICWAKNEEYLSSFERIAFGSFRDFLKKYEPRSVAICTLLFKKEAYKQSHPIDYVCFEVENKFLVGYGLDYDGYGRNIPEVYILNE